MKILSILHDDKRTNIFWEPVDTKLIHDYLDIIHDPIDLGTITRNLRLGINTILLLIQFLTILLQGYMVQTMKHLLMMSEKFGLIALSTILEDQGYTF
jgi:hypothetical protein